VDEVIRVQDHWYVLAGSSRADDRARVLKHGETFGVFDRQGDIHHVGAQAQGLYHEGTRFLSRLELFVQDQRPILLNSAVTESNTLLSVDLTNPDLFAEGERAIPCDTVHIFRAKLLWEGVHYERVRLVNYGDRAYDLTVSFCFDADYADVFEVRGTRRARRGTLLPARRLKRGLLLGYRGLDRVTRRTRIEVSETPQRIADKQVYMGLHLVPRAPCDIHFTVACERDEEAPQALSYTRAWARSERAVRETREAVADVFTSNEQFNDWLNRSAADLHMLVTHTDTGAYPYAGVPWFSTPFGRDGIITALECLWRDPGLARGVLHLLAATQADAENAEQDAEPGKILHEARKGEMPELGEVPFLRYYGSVDATPLFVVLAGAYYQRTGDRPFLEAIWPNVERALAWMDQYGDGDGDGFVEYHRRSASGLVQQGWKDSDDSVFHADGALVEGPVALCEVQGYVYAAKQAAAELYRLFGETARAEALADAAQALKTQFNQRFWCEDIGTYALALDGRKQPCRVPSSNAGHCLFTGIADEEHARRVAESLTAPGSFSGWGIRTIAQGAARYNPMSYHNGSIWPHDNALIAQGFAAYGFKDKAVQVLTALFNASLFMDLNRLPELFCGFERLPGQGPTLYPVACSPQAWASGAVFYLLQACLGLSFAPEKPQLRFYHPQLPDYLHQIEIRNLRVGSGVVDLAFRRHPRDVGVNVLRKEGDVEIGVWV